MREHHRSREKLEWKDWGWYVIYPGLATLLLAVTGVALAAGWAFPVSLLAVGMIGHMIVGVHNAWELADWLATRQ